MQAAFLYAIVCALTCFAVILVGSSQHTYDTYWGRVRSVLWLVPVAFGMGAVIGVFIYVVMRR